MTQKLQLLFVSICALSLYTDAMNSENSKLAPKKKVKKQSPKANKMEVYQSELNKTPSKKRTLALTAEEKEFLMAGEEPSKHDNKKMAKTIIGHSPANTEYSVHKNGQMVASVGQNVEQPPATPEINEENALIDAMASSTENNMMDPKSQLEELVELSDTLIWEMAVRSEEEQIIDPKGDLEWFPELIFEKLESFLKNVPETGVSKKAQLAQLATNWAEAKQPIQIDNETAQVEQVENSLAMFSEQLSKSVLSDFKASPALLDIFLSDYMDNEIHQKEKSEFLWKMVNRKPTHYVKNVGQFFGGVQIAMKYLEQAEEIGRWAKKNSFLTAEQVKNLNAIVKTNVANLASLEQSMAAKLGIDSEKIGMPTLMAQYCPSLINNFTNNLPNAFRQSKGVAQLEHAQANDAQIGTALLLTALSAASGEIGGLKAELFGIGITWDAFQAIGHVTKMAELLKQIHG